MSTAPAVKAAPETAKPAWMISRDLGLAALEKGANREAALHLAVALDETRKGWGAPPQEVARITAALRKARAFISVLQLSAEKGATVTVDGVAVGVAPIDREVLVEPGTHRFTTRSETCSGENTVETEAAELRRLSLSCHTYPRWRTPVLVLGAVVAAGGVVTGAAALGVASNRDGQIRTIQDEIRSMGMAPVNMRRTAESLESERVYWLNVGVTSFLLAGAVVAGTTALGIKVPARALPDGASGLSVGLAVGPGGGALWGTW